MAGLLFDNYGGDWAPLPFVDRPHERTHQHRTFLQYMARQISPPEQNPNRPDVDIRDSAKEYLVEIEVPGVKNTSEITVRWTSTYGLVVHGTVERPGWREPKQGRKQQPVYASGENGHGEPSHASAISINHGYRCIMIVILRAMLTDCNIWPLKVM